MGESNYTPPAVPSPGLIILNCLDLANTHGENYNDIESFYNSNLGLTYEEIINQRNDGSFTVLGSQKGGPNIRYIRDPLNTNIIIDMRHMLIIGKHGRIVGNSVETIQGVTGDPSGYDDQDYYSNELGYAFWNEFNDMIQRNPENFVDFLNLFLVNQRFRNSISSPDRCNFNNHG